MKFVDVINLELKAGKGGDGVISFLRELHLANGGPDGGVGGAGGSIYFQGDSNLTTLLYLSKKRQITAFDGAKGRKKNQSGAKGDDVLIKVPFGSVIVDQKNNKVIATISDDKEPILIAKGGAGGKGNASFRTKENRTPQVCENGSEGDFKKITIELKLMADIGIIGFPNAGKSTLLSKISAAKPKIADFPFTTLAPNLGIIQTKNYETIVVADIPGLIEDASQGKGLGLQFLRHIEHCYALVHLLDGQLNDSKLIMERYKIINNELKKYSVNLSNKTQIVCLNKSELVSEDIILNLKNKFKKLKINLLIISSYTNKSSLDNLISEMQKTKYSLDEKVKMYAQKETKVISLENSDPLDKIEIVRKDNVWYVYSSDVKKAVLKVPLLTPQCYTLLNKKLEYLGVFKELKKLNIKENDEVDIYGYRFEWQG